MQRLWDKHRLKPWLTSFILDDQPQPKVHTVFVLQSITNFLSGDLTVKLVTDGDVFIKVIFSSESLAEFSQQSEDCTPEEWDRIMILLQAYKLRLIVHKQQEKSEFVLYVDRFAKWMGEGLRPKTNSTDCMDIPRIRLKSKELWLQATKQTTPTKAETQGDTNSQVSVSLGGDALSELLAQMTQESQNMADISVQHIHAVDVQMSKDTGNVESAAATSTEQGTPTPQNCMMSPVSTKRPDMFFTPPQSPDVSHAAFKTPPQYLGGLPGKVVTSADIDVSEYSPNLLAKLMKDADFIIPGVQNCELEAIKEWSTNNQATNMAAALSKNSDGITSSQRLSSVTQTKERQSFALPNPMSSVTETVSKIPKRIGSAIGMLHIKKSTQGNKSKPEPLISYQQVDSMRDESLAAAASDISREKIKHDDNIGSTSAGDLVRSGEVTHAKPDQQNDKFAWANNPTLEQSSLDMHELHYNKYIEDDDESLKLSIDEITECNKSSDCEVIPSSTPKEPISSSQIQVLSPSQHVTANKNRNTSIHENRKKSLTNSDGGSDDVIPPSNEPVVVSSGSVIEVSSEEPHHPLIVHSSGDSTKSNPDIMISPSQHHQNEKNTSERSFASPANIYPATQGFSHQAFVTQVSTPKKCDSNVNNRGSEKHSPTPVEVSPASGTRDSDIPTPTYSPPKRIKHPACRMTATQSPMPSTQMQHSFFQWTCQTPGTQSQMPQTQNSQTEGDEVTLGESQEGKKHSYHNWTFQTQTQQPDSQSPLDKAGSNLSDHKSAESPNVLFSDESLVDITVLSKGKHMQDEARSSQKRLVLNSVSSEEASPTKHSELDHGFVHSTQTDADGAPGVQYDLLEISLSPVRSPAKQPNNPSRASFDGSSDPCILTIEDSTKDRKRASTGKAESSDGVVFEVQGPKVKSTAEFSHSQCILTMDDELHNMDISSEVKKRSDSAMKQGISSGETEEGEEKRLAKMRRRSSIEAYEIAEVERLKDIAVVSNVENNAEKEDAISPPQCNEDPADTESQSLLPAKPVKEVNSAGKTAEKKLPDSSKLNKSTSDLGRGTTNKKSRLNLIKKKTKSSLDPSKCFPTLPGSTHKKKFDSNVLYTKDKSSDKSEQGISRGGKKKKLFNMNAILEDLQDIEKDVSVSNANNSALCKSQQQPDVPIVHIESSQTESSTSVPGDNLINTNLHSEPNQRTKESKKHFPSVVTKSVIPLTSRSRNVIPLTPRSRNVIPLTPRNQNVIQLTPHSQNVTRNKPSSGSKFGQHVCNVKPVVSSRKRSISPGVNKNIAASPVSGNTIKCPNKNTDTKSCVSNRSVSNVSSLIPDIDPSPRSQSTPSNSMPANQQALTGQSIRENSYQAHAGGQNVSSDLLGLGGEHNTSAIRERNKDSDESQDPLQTLQNFLSGEGLTLKSPLDSVIFPREEEQLIFDCFKDMDYVT